MTVSPVRRATHGLERGKSTDISPTKLTSTNLDKISDRPQGNTNFKGRKFNSNPAKQLNRQNSRVSEISDVSLPSLNNDLNNEASNAIKNRNNLPDNDGSLAEALKRTDSGRNCHNHKVPLWRRSMDRMHPIEPCNSYWQKVPFVVIVSTTLLWISFCVSLAIDVYSGQSLKIEEIVNEGKDSDISKSLLNNINVFRGRPLSKFIAVFLGIPSFILGCITIKGILNLGNFWGISFNWEKWWLASEASSLLASMCSSLMCCDSSSFSGSAGSSNGFGNEISGTDSTGLRVHRLLRDEHIRGSTQHSNGSDSSDIAVDSDGIASDLYDEGHLWRNFRLAKLRSNLPDPANRLIHIVMIPAYKEEPALLELSLLSLAGSRLDSRRHIVPVLCFEHREGKEIVLDKAQKVMSQFQSDFVNIFCTIHPAREHETVGKHSNLAWGFEELARACGAAKRFKRVAKKSSHSDNNNTHNSCSTPSGAGPRSLSSSSSISNPQPDNMVPVDSNDNTVTFGPDGGCGGDIDLESEEEFQHRLGAQVYTMVDMKKVTDSCSGEVREPSLKDCERGVYHGASGRWRLDLVGSETAEDGGVKLTPKKFAANRLKLPLPLDLRKTFVLSTDADNLVHRDFFLALSRDSAQHAENFTQAEIERFALSADANSISEEKEHEIDQRCIWTAWQSPIFPVLGWRDVSVCNRIYCGMGANLSLCRCVCPTRSWNPFINQHMTLYSTYVVTYEHLRRVGRELTLRGEDDLIYRRGFFANLFQEKLRFEKESLMESSGRSGRSLDPLDPLSEPNNSNKLYSHPNVKSSSSSRQISKSKFKLKNCVTNKDTDSCATSSVADSLADLGAMDDNKSLYKHKLNLNSLRVSQKSINMSKKTSITTSRMQIRALMLPMVQATTGFRREEFVPGLKGFIDWQKGCWNAQWEQANRHMDPLPLVWTLMQYTQMAFQTPGRAMSLVTHLDIFFVFYHPMFSCFQVGFVLVFIPLGFIHICFMVINKLFGCQAGITQIDGFDSLNYMNVTNFCCTRLTLLSSSTQIPLSLFVCNFVAFFGILFYYLAGHAFLIALLEPPRNGWIFCYLAPWRSAQDTSGRLTKLTHRAGFPVQESRLRRYFMSLLDGLTVMIMTPASTMAVQVIPFIWQATKLAIQGPQSAYVVGAKPAIEKAGEGFSKGEQGGGSTISVGPLNSDLTAGNLKNLGSLNNQYLSNDFLSPRTREVQNRNDEICSNSLSENEEINGGDFKSEPWRFQRQHSSDSLEEVTIPICTTQNTITNLVQSLTNVNEPGAGDNFPSSNVPPTAPPPTYGTLDHEPECNSSSTSPENLLKSSSTTVTAAAGGPSQARNSNKLRSRRQLQQLAIQQGCSMNRGINNEDSDNEMEENSEDEGVGGEGDMHNMMDNFRGDKNLNLDSSAAGGDRGGNLNVVSDLEDTRN